MVIRANISAIFQSEEHVHDFKEPAHVIISDFEVFKKQVTEFVSDELGDGTVIISGFVNDRAFYIVTNNVNINFSPIENAINDLNSKEPMYSPPWYPMTIEKFEENLQESDLAKLNGQIGHIIEMGMGTLGFQPAPHQIEPTTPFEPLEDDEVPVSGSKYSTYFTVSDGKVETSIGEVELLKLVNVLE